MYFYSLYFCFIHSLFFLYLLLRTKEHKLQNNEKSKRLVENKNFKINIDSLTSGDSVSLNNKYEEESNTQKKNKSS